MEIPIGIRGDDTVFPSLHKRAKTPMVCHPARRLAVDCDDGESDESLLAGYRDHGALDAFDALVRRYERELYRYLVRFLGNRTLAEDVLQNTFLQIHLKCGLYQDGWPARPWLYKIATNQPIDALRRNGRYAAVSLDRPGGMEEMDVLGAIDGMVNESPEGLSELQQQERREWIRDRVARLPEPVRQVLILAYDEGLRYRQIAEILGIPLGTVKSRLHHAVARLQEQARIAHLVEAA
jgi:RNA polymerase sigma-70 factor (ECF subfamily)